MCQSLAMSSVYPNQCAFSGHFVSQHSTLTLFFLIHARRGRRSSVVRGFRQASHFFVGAKTSCQIKKKKKFTWDVQVSFQPLASWA